MSRIYTNVNSLQAQHKLNRNNSEMKNTLTRLSSGLRINTAKDDPAGLIASETLRAEIAGIDQAIANSERASSVIATAEGALNEVSALLVDIKGLINASANEGAIAIEEIEANQLQVDSAINSIKRIANSTQFEGVKLLNGSLDFTVSGVTSTELTDVSIDEVRFGTASTVNVAVNMIDSAETGRLIYSGSSLTDNVTLEVAGAKGVEVFTFHSSTSMAGIASAINQAVAVTGVSAIASADIDGGGNAGLIISSNEYGSKKFASVETLSGTFGTKLVGTATAATRDHGEDATVSVNSVTAVSDGLNIQINGPTVAFQAKLSTTFNSSGGSSTFVVTGGGAKFQLGPEVNAQQMSIVGIQSIAPHRLGNASVGWLSDVQTGGSKSIIDANYQEAGDIITQAIGQVATMRGRLGAFQKNTLETNINSLGVALENVTASESAIRDADFAAETAALTRSQILVQAGTNVLTIANSSPQNVLALLG